jgi:hypothetical protein
MAPTSTFFAASALGLFIDTARIVGMYILDKREEEGNY